MKENREGAKAMNDKQKKLGESIQSSQRKNITREALFFALDSYGQVLTSRTIRYGSLALSFGTHSDFIKPPESVKLFVLIATYLH